MHTSTRTSTVPEFYDAISPDDSMHVTFTIHIRVDTRVVERSND